MSSEGDSGGQPSSTTISTIAVQAGDSQIIITLLKSGPLLQLQLTEAQPDLLEMGSNQEETKKLIEEHDQLLIKLKKHEGGVWALLEEADSTAKEKRRDEAEVYEAMANTLSQAWSSLISLLERRRALLQLSSEFFDRALEFAIRIDEAEEFQSRGQELEDTESLRELLQTHSVMKRGLLERSLLVMTKREELLSCLRELQQSEELRNCSAGGLQGWSSSCSRVESLVEILQDRRRQVDLSMNQQKLHLQLILRLFQWERQEQEVTEWFRSQAEVYLERDALGSSLTDNQGLLQEYKDFEAKAKEWSLLVEVLLAQASELQTEEVQLHPEECPEAGQVCERSRTLKSLQDKLWSLMMGRQAQLQESNAFFDSANKAFEVLGGIESQIKNLKTQTMSLTDLAKKHEELLRTIKDSSMEPIQRGQVMLQKSHLHSDQMAGVQRMLGYVRERVESLSRECHAHRALTDKRQQLVSLCEDLIDKISVWIKGCSNVLSSNSEPGEQLSQSEDLLNKHLELSEQTQETAADAEAMSGLLQELRGLECPEATELSNRASLLEEELKTVTRNITQRIESIRPYVSFLRIAEEVEEQMEELRESYNRKPEEEENEESRVGGGGVDVKEQGDARWQSMLQRFLTMQDLGNNFINSSNMVSEKLNLNVRAAIVVVEKTMEDLTKRKGDLSDLWTSWQLHVSHIKSVKKQWKKFKEQLKKTLNDLRSVEEVLVPATKIDLGSDLQTVSKLLDNFNLAKPQFMQLNAEVEYMVKTSELLALKGGPVKEKSERVTELLRLHHRIKEKIREYETLLNMAVKFHQLHNELEKLLLCEPVRAFTETSQARTQLSQHQERQSHVQHLHKLAVSLGTDISTSVQQSQATGFCVRRLAERLERLERGCASWIAQAHRCEESLNSNVHYCVFKEEITELRESFKDLKKKLNNLKFNFMKKNEKSRNLKAVKNQIQQIDVYVEKLQVLKRRIQVFTAKVSSSSERHLVGSSPREVEDAVNELQRQLGDFDRSVEEYRQNLEMSVKLQQAMEEYQFWCDEASATIVRVGKYSSQCQTREAVATLYKQFEKFVWPTVPQQEERISQITELAIKLHGAEEGKRYVEKTITKHTEIVDSIKELCNGLMDLEAKLQTEAVKQLSENKQDVTEQKDLTSNQLAEKTENQLLDCLDVSEQKETGHTPELTTGADGKEIPIKMLTSDNPLKITGSQDLPDKETEAARHTVSEGQTVVSESSSFTKQEYSQTSRVETFTSRSTMETKEESHSSFSCTHTFNLSCSPHTLRERDRKAYALHQTGPGAQVRASSPPLATSSGHSFSDIQKEFRKERQGLGLKNARNFSGYNTSSDPQDAAGGLAEAELQQEALTEESLSNDEYECTSPDDISLPPLSETPESNIVQLENDLDDGCCVSSSHSIHINQCNQYSEQRQSQPEPSCQTQPGPVEGNPSPAAAQGSRFRAESSSFIQSPLTVPAPSLVSSTLSSILKTKTSHPSPGPSLPQGTANSSSFPTVSSSHNQGLQPQCGLPGASLPPDPASLPLGTSTEFHQTLYSLHESVTEIQECVHDPCVQPRNTHAPPSSLTTEQDPDVCRPTAIREEIRLPSSSRAMGSLTAQGPCLTRPLASATVVEGSPVTLEVEVTGYPEPTLTWLKNGESLASGDHIQLSHKEGKHALFIERVKEGDAGVYEIQASSPSGSVSSSAALQVTGNSCSPDLFTSLQLDWHTCFGTLCILLWLLYLLVL